MLRDVAMRAFDLASELADADARVRVLHRAGKEGLGKATDNDELEAEGKTDQVKGNLKQAGDKVKDALKD